MSTGPTAILTRALSLTSIQKQRVYRHVVVAIALTCFGLVLLIQIINDAFRRMGTLLALAQPQEIKTLSLVMRSIMALNLATTLNGNTNTPDGTLNVNFGLTLGPDVGAEIAIFPQYVNALSSNSYSVYSGWTSTLWTSVPKIMSSMGGIQFGSDWWDVVAQTVASTSYIVYTGVPANFTLLTASFSRLVNMLGVDADGKLSADQINLLLPRSAIPKVAEAGKLVFKSYATDPNLLTTFNLVVPDAQWLTGVGALDITAPNSKTTCRLLQYPSLKKLYSPGSFSRFADQACWVNSSILPSAPYASYLINSSDIGDWVVECLTKNLTATCNNMRWHSHMYERSATAFYSNSMAITGSRYLILSQKQLLRLAYGNTSEVSSGILAANILSSPLVGEGTYVPGPMSVYVVDTDTLQLLVRWPYFCLWILCLVTSRSTLTGICTMVHFMVESPLAIFLDCIYGFALFITGPRTASILLTLQGISTSSRLYAFSYAMTIMRPLTTIYLSTAKQVALLFFPRLHVIEHITIIQCAFLMVIGTILAQLMTPSIVDIGMYRGTTIDQITSYVYQLQLGFLAVSIVFLHVFCFISLWTKKRQAGRPCPSDTTPTLQYSSYDTYLADKWLSFGVTLLQRCYIDNIPCVVLDGSILWLEALFNMNVNLLTCYSLALEAGTVLFMEQTGKLFITNIVPSENYAAVGAILIGGLVQTPATRAPFALLSNNVLHHVRRRSRSTSERKPSIKHMTLESPQ